MQWVIKTTKLCNLRCRYCYEWDHLSDPTRMSDQVWRHALVAIREYAQLTAERCGYQIPLDIIWHGGEPTLLPRSYFERVVELQREVFSREWIERRRVRNCLQTNLFSIRDDQLDVFEEYGFELGISVDFCPGVRLTAGGRPTEDAVRKNMRRLQARGVPFSIITVLAGHSVPQIERIFAEVVEWVKPVRLLPLFGGPPARPMAGVASEQHDILAAMMTFFDLWLDAGMEPRVDPLDSCIRTVALKRMNLTRPTQDRALLGNDVLVIDRDGTLSCDAYREHGVLGNLTQTPIIDIIDGPAYRYLIDEETRLKSKVCGACAFQGACDTSPIARNFDSHVVQDCPTEKYLLPMIEAHLEARGYFDEEFAPTARAMTEAFVTDAYEAALA
jgi:uncharacterized protein